MPDVRAQQDDAARLRTLAEQLDSLAARVEMGETHGCLLYEVAHAVERVAVRVDQRSFDDA